MRPALVRIAFIDALVSIRGFTALDKLVRRTHVSSRQGAETAAELCQMMNRAESYYPRKLQCLRRSAAMTWLFRSRGYPAEMVVGASILPFLAHAWVELEGHVVGDDESLVRERYIVLERYPATSRT
ncbi:MAG: hypothetical protein QOH21_1440 [Acidobacteriota bacterium]|jgi:hypothetical protein|nr:hypothetical protein [Acidobacteriota bacterium]